MSEPMPPDPFSAPQADWSPMAAGLSGFYSALIAHGMPSRGGDSADRAADDDAADERSGPAAGQVDDDRLF